MWSSTDEAPRLQICNSFENESKCCCDVMSETIIRAAPAPLSE